MTIYTELGRSGLVMMEKFGENFCTFWKHIFENGRNPKKKKKNFFPRSKNSFSSLFPPCKHTETYHSFWFLRTPFYRSKIWESPYGLEFFLDMANFFQKSSH
jgi:hypothetical protein